MKVIDDIAQAMVMHPLTVWVINEERGREDRTALAQQMVRDEASSGKQRTHALSWVICANRHMRTFEDEYGPAQFDATGILYVANELASYYRHEVLRLGTTQTKRDRNESDGRESDVSGPGVVAGGRGDADRRGCSHAATVGDGGAADPPDR